jgi:hypothetical protein
VSTGRRDPATRNHGQVSRTIRTTARRPGVKGIPKPVEPKASNKLSSGRPSRQAVYQRLEEAAGELKDRLGGLPSPVEAEDIWTAIWYQEAHHSTALEGNTLVLQQVELLLADGRAVGNKALREYMEVRGVCRRGKVGLRPGPRTKRLEA